MVLVHVNTPRVVNVLPQLVACSRRSPPARVSPTQAVQPQQAKQQRAALTARVLAALGVQPEPACAADGVDRPDTSRAAPQHTEAVDVSGKPTSEVCPPPYVWLSSCHWHSS